MGRGDRRRGGGGFRSRGNRRNSSFRDFDNDKYGDRRRNGGGDRDRGGRRGRGQRSGVQNLILAIF